MVLQCPFLSDAARNRSILRICGIISAQPDIIVKQICFPNGNVLFLSLLSLSKN